MKVSLFAVRTADIDVERRQSGVVVVKTKVPTSPEFPRPIYMVDVDLSVDGRGRVGGPFGELERAWEELKHAIGAVLATYDAVVGRERGTLLMELLCSVEAMSDGELKALVAGNARVPAAQINEEGKQNG